LAALFIYLTPARPEWLNAVLMLDTSENAIANCVD
jgi:hypothetical protein